MEVTFINGPRELLQIDDAILIHKNFSGRETEFNRKGDRNFSVKITDEELANVLLERGWNVRIKAARIEGEEPFMHLPVKIKVNARGPKMYLITGNVQNELDEESMGCIDNIDIERVDLDIRAFDWTMPGGKSGRSAYLQAIRVYQVLDRFARPNE